MEEIGLESTRIALTIGARPLAFDIKSLNQIVDEIAVGSPAVWERLITPNLHHAYLLREDPGLHDLYAGASAILPDGWPVARLLSFVGRRPVYRVAGSDVLEGLLISDGGGKMMVLVGGQDQSALDRVAARARAVGWGVSTEPAPAVELENKNSRDALIRRVGAAAGDGGIVVLGLGAPKQELFARDLSQLPGKGYILCLGMAINFSAGAVSRAPMWMQRYQLEWVFRIRQETRRLLPRYIKDAGTLLPLILDNVRNRR